MATTSYASAHNNKKHTSGTLRKYVRGLEKQAVHDKHKLSLSNHKTIYCKHGQHSSPTELRKCSDAFWNMPTVNAAMRRNALNFNYGQLYNKKLAFMRKQAYMPGEGIARDSRWPLCRQEDSGGHGGCSHTHMKKQYIARHDKAMRAVVQAFTKGSLEGRFYLIADVCRLDG